MASPVSNASATRTEQTSVRAPYTSGAAVTPSDTDLWPCPSRALYVGVSGDVKVLLADDTQPVTLVGVPVGLLLVQAKRVYATSTTATSIVALF